MKLAATSRSPSRTPSGSSGRELHDRVLAGLVQPRQFLQGSLLEDVWLVRTDDEEGRRNATVTLRFDSPVSPGPELLSEDLHSGDLLTLKLAVLYALDAQRGWANAAHSLPQYLGGLLVLTRWRNAQGIRRFSDLTPAFFEAFVGSLIENGSRELLPFEERIDQYLANIRAGSETLPIRDGRLQSNLVARRLGVALRVQVPPRCWESILRELRRQNERVYNKTKKSKSLEVDDHTRAHVHSLIKPWGHLYDLRDLLVHDPLTFRPWNARETAWTVAGTISNKLAERTPFPPVKQTCFLINAALDFIQNSSSLILEMGAHIDELLFALADDGSARDEAISSYIDEVRSRFSVEDCPRWLREITCYQYRQTRNGGKKEKPEFRDVIYAYLPGACAILLAAFSARRRVELVSLLIDCLWRGEYGRLFLTSWSAKNLRRLDSIPAPESLELVIKVLTQLSTRARALDDTKWLFSFREPSGEAACVRFEESVQKFAVFANLPPCEDGSLWLPMPHQFRVFFATIYYHRFDFPSLTALSQFLKQNDIDATRTYVTALVRGGRLQLADEAAASRGQRADLKVRASARTRASDFEEGRLRFIRDIASAVIDGEVELAGAGGRQWMSDLSSLVDRVQKSIRFTSGNSEGTFNDALGGWVSGKSLEPHPQGHSYCKCTGDKTDLASAACLAAKFEAEGVNPTDNLAPDLAYAVDLTCFICPHRVGLPCNTSYLSAALSEAEAASQTGLLSSERRIASERATKLRREAGSLTDLAKPDSGLLQ